MKETAKTPRATEQLDARQQSTGRQTGGRMQKDASRMATQAVIHAKDWQRVNTVLKLTEELLLSWFDPFIG